MAYDKAYSSALNSEKPVRQASYLYSAVREYITLYPNPRL